MSAAGAIDRSPSRTSGWIAVGTGFVALAAAGPWSWPSLAAGTVGFLFVVAAVLRGSRSAAGLGTAGLLGGLVFAGIEGAPAAVLLVGAVAAMLAWDAGQTAIDVGEQLGREAETTRIEVVHAAGSAGVGVVIAAVGYGLFRGVGGGQPLAVLVFLVVAAVLVASALR